MIRCLLIVPFPESSLNDEAGRLFMESYTEYERRVKVWVSVHASKSLSGDADANPTTDCGSNKKATGERGLKTTVVKGGVAATSGQSALTAKSAGGGESVDEGAVGEKGGDGGGGGAGGGPSKRREEAAVPRKTVKDRQKEAKKRGLKRL